VGANIGLYAHGIRHNGFNGRIISFEPLSNAFAQLENLANNDTNWLVENYALGDFNGETEINISENSVSSSILDINNEFMKIVPESRFIGHEKIKIRTIDSIIDDFYNAGNKLFIKIDAQGFEKNIIEGAKRSLDKVEGFQLELSINHFYKNSIDFFEMLNYMNSLGYRLVSLETGWHNNSTGEMMEIDGIFLKKNT
jgi:FkbM family methyltransferase